MEMEQTPFHIVIYTREGCGLCEKAKEKVERVAREYPITVEVFDITRDPNLEKEYDELIPVVHIDGEKVFVSKVTELWLRRELEIRTKEHT
jgi:glutaredoxin